MNVAHTHLDLEDYLNAACGVSKDHPVVISKFILEAKVLNAEVRVSPIPGQAVVWKIALL